jgi:hypothetical protein
MISGPTFLQGHFQSFLGKTRKIPGGLLKSLPSAPHVGSQTNSSPFKVTWMVLNTGGPFGCGDGLVYYYTGKKRTGDVERDISSALNALLKIRTEFVGNYYNPTHNAHLHVKNVEVNHTTGRVVVYLEGSIPKPADVCEAKRVHDQVWETARQISGYRDVGIHVGNKLLGDLIAVGDR